MGFFKKFKKFILPAIGAVIAGPIGAAAGSAVSSYTSNHNIGQALAAGFGSYAGGQIAGNVLGPSLGTVGSTAFDGLPSNALSNFALNSIPGELANTSIGSVIGSSVGSDLASNTFASSPSGPSGPAQFTPQQGDPGETPASLTGLGSLTNDQQSTNLANQGTYGSGNGSQEQQYFLNLLNNKLVDESGHTNDLGTLKPIEQSYLQKLGFGGYGDTSSLLEAISKWKQQQQAA
jgi:hypothetical protein